MVEAKALHPTEQFTFKKHQPLSAKAGTQQSNGLANSNMIYNIACQFFEGPAPSVGKLGAKSAISPYRSRRGSLLLGLKVQSASAVRSTAPCAGRLVLPCECSRQ